MTRELRIDIEAEVTTSDGQHVGKVDRVVFDPRTLTVSHVVIHRGIVLTRDIVVPVAAIAFSAERVVRMKITAAALEQMPDFVDDEYVIPPRAAPIGPYIPGSVLWPVGYVYAPAVVEEERHVPGGFIDVTEGTEVRCSDGIVGTVDEVLMDPATGRVTGFIIRRGRGLDGDVTIPVSWVKHAAQSLVELACDKEAVAKLAPQAR